MFTRGSSSMSRRWSVGVSSGDSRKQPLDSSRASPSPPPTTTTFPSVSLIGSVSTLPPAFPLGTDMPGGSRYSPTLLHLWEEEWIQSLSFYSALRSEPLSLAPGDAESSFLLCCSSVGSWKKSPPLIAEKGSSCPVTLQAWSSQVGLAFLSTILQSVHRPLFTVSDRTAMCASSWGQMTRPTCGT